MELITNGTLWYYESYDHKAAVEELKLTNQNQISYKFPSEYIPDEVKRNHIVWRIGKLRTMMFDPDGMIQKMYVGRSFKYTKRFFPNQVGQTIKPIINVKTDKLGLIKAGLAVDESSLKL
jgi:hypothetical protein